MVTGHPRCICHTRINKQQRGDVGELSQITCVSIGFHMIQYRSILGAYDMVSHDTTTYNLPILSQFSFRKHRISSYVLWLRTMHSLVRFLETRDDACSWSGIQCDADLNIFEIFLGQAQLAITRATVDFAFVPPHIVGCGVFYGTFTMNIPSLKSLVTLFMS